MKFDNKKILITGGSSGIGKALITSFYHRGARQFAVIGRDEAKMQTLKRTFPDADFIFLVANLANPKGLKTVVDHLAGQWNKIDILINNAGVVSAGALESISDDDIIHMQQINVSSLIILTKYALPLLRQSDDAAIINVSSGLGIIGMAFYTPYAATKAAVRQFSEALRRELNGQPIHVMTLYPTATDTPMMRSAGASGMDSPEDVAERTIEGLLGRQLEVIMGGDKMLENRKLNFEDPATLDERLKGNYEVMKQRATGHRSM
jgi:short-subunit dehydrogenase